MVKYILLNAIISLTAFLRPSFAVVADGPGSVCDCDVVNVNVAHTGDPVGQLKKINGVDMYITYPPGNKTDHAILYMTDVFGVQLAQNRLLADSFAKAGYAVVEPDYFRGDPAPADLVTPGFNMGSWFAKHPDAEIMNILETSLKYMRGEFGAKKIGAVGYCFGGKYVARFMAKDKGLDAGFVAHPSRVEKADLEAIAGPISVAAAETDSAFPANARHDAETTFQKLKIPYQINLYGSVSHGFGVRANVSNKREKYAKEEAYLQAVRWFDTWLKE